MKMPMPVIQFEGEEYILRKIAQSTLEENKNLKAIVAKELGENDEFGSEFVITTILKDEILKLTKANEILKEALTKYTKEQAHGFTARQALEEADKIIEPSVYYVRPLSPPVTFDLKKPDLNTNPESDEESW